MDPLEKTVTAGATAGAGRGVALKGRNEVKGGDGLTPATAKTSSSGGEWVNVGGGGGQKMAANVRGGTPMAAGMGEAMSSLLSQGSGMKFDKKTGQSVYKTGRFKGLTTAQVEEKGKQMWDKASPAVREKYAARVRNRPTQSEVKEAGGGMAAFGGDGPQWGSGLQDFDDGSGY